MLMFCFFPVRRTCKFWFKNGVFGMFFEIFLIEMYQNLKASRCKKIKIKYSIGVVFGWYPDVWKIKEMKELG